MADEVVDVTVKPAESEAIPDDANLDEHAVSLPNAGAQPKQYVPLGALKAERDSKKVLSERLATLEAENAKYKPIVQQFEQARPAIEALSKRPDLLQHALQGTAPSRATEQPTEDAEALEFARDYELFDQQGRPDAARARRMIDNENKRVNAAVQKQVAPVAQATARDKAAYHRQWAHQYVDSGHLTQAAYDAYIGSVPDAVMANEQAAQAALAMARGHSAGFGALRPTRQTTDDDAPEPLETVSPGRREASTPNIHLTPAMKAALANRGKSPADLQAFAKRMDARDTSRGVPLGEK